MDKEQEAHDRLVELVKKHALERAPKNEPFKLANGDPTSYYINCKKLCLSPVGLNAVVNSLNKHFIPGNFDAIGGPCVGADPIIGGIMFLAGMGIGQRRNMRGFLVRKTGKDHGNGNESRIIGSVQKGDRCILVEDVTTTGESALDAVDQLKEFGCEVVKVVAVVDRLQGAASQFDRLGIEFDALLNIMDLGIKPVEGKDV